MSGWRANFCAAIAVIPLFCGCAHVFSHFVAASPNHFSPLAGTPLPLPSLEEIAGVDESFFVDVGPPDARLAVSVIHPRHSPRGTVLLLHGVYARSFFTQTTARTLAARGYRAVMVDLRGHGRSSGRYLTYGIYESLDLSQVLDELERRGLVEGKVGVYGFSYGAATAIQFAAQDERVAAVVAASSFSTLREEAPDFVRGSFPGLGHLASDELTQRTIDLAGEKAGFDPDAVNVPLAASQLTAPLLLLHGTADRRIPSTHSQRIHAAGGPSELQLLDGYTHFGVSMDYSGEIAALAGDWFDRHCPP